MSCRAVIFAAGQLGDAGRVRELLSLRPGDRILAADAGLTHALDLGVRPELVVGDFDSMPAELWQEVERHGLELLRVPREKDETDTELAIRTALRWGCSELVLLAGVGSRLDHSLANLLLLAGLPRGIRASLVNDRNRVQFLHDGEELTIPAREGVYLSLLPLTPEVSGVDIEGVHWPLRGARLAWTASLGISNEFRAPVARVRVGTGCLAVIEAED